MQHSLLHREELFSGNCHYGASSPAQPLDCSGKPRLLLASAAQERFLLERLVEPGGFGVQLEVEDEACVGLYPEQVLKVAPQESIGICDIT